MSFMTFGDLLWAKKGKGKIFLESDIVSLIASLNEEVLLVTDLYVSRLTTVKFFGKLFNNISYRRKIKEAGIKSNYEKKKGKSLLLFGL